MKTILNKLEKISIQLEEKITDREITFDNRSEKWQESFKGEEFEEKTEQIREVFEFVQDAINTTADFID